MSITIIQTGNQLDSSTSLYFPHSLNKPSYFRCLSTEYNNYYDFKYVYKLYTIDGMIFTIKKVGGKNGYGEFNPQKVIQTYLDDTLLYDTSVEYKDMFLEYRVSVQEFYDGSLQGTEMFFGEKNLGANYLYNFNSTTFPYQIENTYFSRFICMNDVNTWYKQQLDSKAHWVYIPNNEGDYIYYWVYYTYNDGTGSGSGLVRYLYSISINPDYEFDPSSTTIITTEKSGISVPVGFGTLRNTTVNKVGYYDVNGIWYNDSGTQIGIDSNMPDYWKRDKLLVSLNSGQTEDYKFELTCDDVRTATINWINVYGGQDFFNFEKFRVDDISSSKNMYRKTPYKLENEHRVDDLKNSAYEIYNNIKTYEIELTTNLLTTNEIKLLEGLWISNKIELTIDDDLIPVISLEKSKKIPSLEIPTLFYYKIKVLYSKII